MLIAKSRYRNLSICFNGKDLNFINHEYKTKDPEEIEYLRKNQGSNYAIVNDSKEKQDIQTLRLQSRDLHFPGDVETAKKDDLIQFIESVK